MQSLAKEKLGKQLASFPKTCTNLYMPLYSYESVCDVRCHLNRHESGLSNIVTRNMHQKTPQHRRVEPRKERKEKGETVYGNLYFNPNTLSSLAVRGIFR